jgi:hypothetical protein
MKCLTCPACVLAALVGGNGLRVGLDDRLLVLHRAARLLLIGGVCLGTTLALLGLLAALTLLL